MNILQIEDTVKGLPDQALYQEAQSPSGQVPQYLVISEIQRRTDMRKRYSAESQQPAPTVKDQILQQGMAPVQPGGIGSMAPPVRMAGGGITQSGMPGEYALYGAFQDLKAKAMALADITGRSFNEIYDRLVSQAQMRGPNYQMTAPAVERGHLPAQSPVEQPPSPTGLSMPLDPAGQYVNGLLYDAYAEANRAPSQPTSIADGYVYDDEYGGIEFPIPATDTSYEPEASAKGAVEVVADIVDEPKTAPTSLPSGDKSVQGASPVQTRSRPSLTLEDLVGDTRRQMGAQALIGLGAGIAGNDLSGGIAAVGEAAREGSAAMRELGLQQRVANFQSERDDVSAAAEQARYDVTAAAEQSRHQEQMGLKREELAQAEKIARYKVEADLKLSDRVSARQLLAAATDAVSENVLLDDKQRAEFVDSFVRRYAAMLRVDISELEPLIGAQASQIGGAPVVNWSDL